VLGGYTVRRLSEGYVLSRLEHDAEALLGAAHWNGQDGFSVPDNRITPVYLQPRSGHYYALRSGDRPPGYSRSLWDFALPVPVLAPGQRRVQKVAGPGGQRLLLLSAGYRKQDHPLVIGVAEDVGQLDHQINRYQWSFGLVAVLLLGLLVLLQRRLVRQSFLPLERIREQVQLVVNGAQERLDTQVPSEVYPLVSEINHLLALLETRLTRSRHALGNLAHALNTPLNLVMQELDDAALPKDSHERLNERMERIHRLIERELRRARLAGGGKPGQHFDPATDVPGLFQALQGMYRDRNLEFQLADLPAGALALDREDMLELLGNLLDNACKWSRGRVALRIGREDGLRIQVEDDGPGVDAANLQQLTARGVRIDEQAPGHGLGLAIVHDIVRLYDGTLEFSRSERLGGLCVRVVLPTTAGT
jgi:signal transduction histidine kinase